MGVGDVPKISTNLYCKVFFGGQVSGGEGGRGDTAPLDDVWGYPHLG